MKTKFTLVALLVIGLNQAIIAQATDGETILRKQNSDSIQGWKKGGVIALSVAQTSLSNWAAGGENSLAINGLFGAFANYKKGKNVWDNSLDVGYGLLKQGEGSDYMKTDDKFDILSKYGRKAFYNFYYAALMNFKTQMTVGKDYKTDTSKISNFLAPAYLIGAIGMDYKPSSYFSTFVAPATCKLTYVNDQELADSGAYGVEPATFDTAGHMVKNGEKYKSEFGGYVRIIFSKNDFGSAFLKNVSFTTKVDLFSNYLEEPQNIDVSWETQIVLKVNKYISVNASTHLVYDDNIATMVEKNGVMVKAGPRVQFKDILGVGFSCKF